MRPLCCTLLLTAACKGDKSDPIVVPDDLAMLEDLATGPPDGRADDAYPEEMNIVSGSETDYDWAHADAYVHASIADTWAALRTGEVVVDHTRVQEWSMAEVDAGDFDYQFEIQNTSEDIVTVEFELTWIHGAVDGTKDDPAQVAFRWQKTDGTEFIERMEGSGMLYAIDDSTTELQLIEHLTTVGSAPEDIELYFQSLYGCLLLSVSGGDMSACAAAR